MQQFAFYPAFIATFISVAALTSLAIREHNPLHLRTMSELAADRKRTLTEFRIILLVCGTLFEITLLFFIVPRLPHKMLTSILFISVYVVELLVGFVPLRKGRQAKLHNIFAYSMVAFMLILAFAFCLLLPGKYAISELIIFITMSLLSLLSVVNRNRFIFYELAFIFTSHVSILVAALGLK